jgi:hypothetical protein
MNGSFDNMTPVTLVSPGRKNKPVFCLTLTRQRGPGHRTDLSAWKLHFFGLLQLGETKMGNGSTDKLVYKYTEHKCTHCFIGPCKIHKKCFLITKKYIQP